MKIVFVILSIIVALFQVGRSAPTEVAQKISSALTDCATKHNLERKDVVAKLHDNALPEDDDDFTKFFACFAQTLEAVDDDGDVHGDKLVVVLQAMLVQKLGDVPDVEEKALQIATKAVEHCKDTPKADSVGLSAIKKRNCMKAFVATQKCH